MRLGISASTAAGLASITVMVSPLALEPNTRPAAAVEAEIPIRIPGLERYRGVLPIGLAYHEKSGWLLVAEAGINAVGVIDVNQRRVLGHIPAAWFPTRVVMGRDTVYVANGRGFGQGPNAPRGQARHGSPDGWEDSRKRIRSRPHERYEIRNRRKSGPFSYGSEPNATRFKLPSGAIKSA